MKEVLLIYENNDGPAELIALAFAEGNWRITQSAYICFKIIISPPPVYSLVLLVITKHPLLLCAILCDYFVIIVKILFKKQRWLSDYYKSYQSIYVLYARIIFIHFLHHLFVLIIMSIFLRFAACFLNIFYLWRRFNLQLCRCC